MSLSVSELIKEIKPYVVGWLSVAGGGAGPYAPSPHDLSSAHHSGSLADSQATQFLKTDGTRALTGNLSVNAGITVDGVDLSAFNALQFLTLAADANAPNERVLVAGSGLTLTDGGAGSSATLAVGAGDGISLSADAVAVDATVVRTTRQIISGSGLTGGGDLSADRTLNVGAGDGISVAADAVAVDATVVRTTRQIISGAGLTGGGDLSADRTLAIGAGAGITVNADDVALTTPGTLTVSSTNAAAGNHTHAITSSSNPGAAASLLASDSGGNLSLVGLSLSGNLIPNGNIAGHLIPSVTDTYDLGSSTQLWRKGWLSELDAVLFAQNVISVIGGWLIIAKGEGVLPALVSSGATTVDFGQAMTNGHFVVLRAAGQVEYLQVGTLVSGTTYNVTRNLDGSGANTWQAGTVYVILGTTGDGRIELNSSDTPRIQMLTQGATYNAQTELLRVGDLNGNWGYAAPTFGIGIGAYAASNTNLTVDATNGIRIRNNTTVIGQWSAAGVITVGQVAASQGNVLLSGGGVQVRTNTTVKLDFQSDGDVFIGRDTSAAATTALAIFNNSQTYNSEAGFAAGDILIGDNTAGKGNIFWDQSTGRFDFRGGTTTEAYIDTDGSIVFAAGDAYLNTDGFSIVIGDADQRKIKFVSGSTIYSEIFCFDAGTSISKYIQVLPISSRDSGISVIASCPSGRSASAVLQANDGTNYATVTAEADGSGARVTIGENVELSIDGSIVASTPIAAHVYHSANQSINDATNTTLLFDSERKDTDTMHFTSAAALTGTVAKNGTTALVGTGTTFTTQLSVGQVIDVPGTATERRVVTAIADNTHLTVNTAFVNTASGQTATRVNKVIVFRTAGIYRVSTNVSFASNATGNRLIAIDVNNLTGAATGTTIAATTVPACSGSVTRLPISTEYEFAQWDFIEVRVFQNSGGALNVTVEGNLSPELRVSRIV